MGTVKEKIENLVGISFIDTIYKFLTFHDFLIASFPFFLKARIKRVKRKQQKCIQQCSKKSKIKVVFFLQNDSIWKYDNLYWLLEGSEKYEPWVIISPYNVHLIYDKEECLNVMRKTFAFAKEQQYRCICCYDFEKKQWLNIRKMLNPDIVFFSKPYKDTIPQYHLYSFEDKLTLYTAYGISCIDLYKANYNLSFHNLLWKYLLETKFQQKMSEEHALSKGENTIIVGCLGTEKLIDISYHPKDVWKPQSHPKKRIIWAPHHTVDYLFNFSNFLVYCDLMLELANKYKDKVQFAFKPHPVLKFKLINIWGKEKTEAYYKQWEDLENTQLETGDYMDLFMTSDALIHDCGSFTAEYLYTKKPVLFMVRDPQVLTHWNPFGKICFDMHYHAQNMGEIKQFIMDVVLNGQDIMKEKREKFFYDYLYPKDGIMPSQKIMNILLSELKQDVI